ncbi:MAG TPA: hypothetical protein VE775_00780 [Pyrinomonadaceae bacterium]|nr:hypothetical protein [Pyrinomonadaceae bacterium]
MSKERVRIERLEIRVKGGARQSAARMADGLGREVLEQLAAARKQLHGAGRVELERVAAGVLRVERGTTTDELRRQVARRIAESVSDRLKK